MSGWIEWKWTEEKPYPETVMTEVFITVKGLGIQPLSDYVGNWFWGDSSGITHYRLA